MERLESQRNRIPVQALALLTSVALVAACSTAPNNHDNDMPHLDIIFASNRTGHFKLWDKNLQTGELTQLTTGPGDDNNPQASPDGTKVTFYSDRDDDSDPDNNINRVYILDRAHPSKPKLFIDNPAHTYDPTFIDATHIAYKYQNNIWIKSVEGGEPRNITPDHPEIEKYKPAVIDATHISYTGRSRHTANKTVNANSDELYTVDLQTGETTRNTNNGISDWFSAVNAVTGMMAFVSRMRTNGPDRIYTARPDTSGRQLLLGLDELTGDCSDVAWFPDGQSVVFVNDAPGPGRYDTIYQDTLAGQLTVLDQQPDTVSLGPIVVKGMEHN
jgi:Tol biopolymer transport system component